MSAATLPDWRDSLPWPGPETHKHARGRLGVVSGKATQTGAARLAARGGLRVGAGLVRILCPPDAAAVIAPAIEAIMLTPFGSPEALAYEARAMDSVVIGPGQGRPSRQSGSVAALTMPALRSRMTTKSEKGLPYCAMQCPFTARARGLFSPPGIADEKDRSRHQAVQAG